SVDHLAHRPGAKPVSKTLQLALGGHPNLVERIDQTEPLIERVAGQLTTESAVILLHEGAQDRAAQRPPRTLLKLALLPGRRLRFGRPLPVGQGPLDKVLLHATFAQKRIDLLQALAQGQVVNVPDNGRQFGAKLLREWNNPA